MGKRGGKWEIMREKVGRRKGNAAGWATERQYVHFCCNARAGRDTLELQAGARRIMLGLLLEREGEN